MERGDDMAYSEKVQLAAIHAVNSIFLALIGASVFIFGLLHMTPITTMGVEYVAAYGSYFGIHTFSSMSASKAALTTSGAK